MAADDLAAWTAYYKDTNLANVHIIAPDGVFKRRPERPWSLCGLHPYQTSKGARLIVLTDPTQPLRSRCYWCPKCLGMAFVALGNAQDLVRGVIELLPRTA